MNKYDRRSANCELELEPGIYEVLPKITAERHTKAKTTGKMVSTWADKNPEKLRQIGMQYDAAHAKAGVFDEDDEVERLRAQSEKKKQKRREKKKQEEKALKKMQQAYMEKRSTTDDEDSEVEATVKKWINRRLKKKGKTSNGRNAKNLMQSRKSTDATSEKTSVHESSNKDVDSEAEGSSEGGSNTPSSTVKDDKEKEVLESDSEDTSETGSESEEDPDFDEKQPWDPVCVMGLRVYAQDTVATVTLGDKDIGDTMTVKSNGTTIVKA